MNHSNQLSLKEYPKKIVAHLEQTRGKVLSFGYGIIEWKSNMKKVFRDFYPVAERTGNY